MYNTAQTLIHICCGGALRVTTTIIRTIFSGTSILQERTDEPDGHHSFHSCMYFHVQNPSPCLSCCQCSNMNLSITPIITPCPSSISISAVPNQPMQSIRRQHCIMDDSATEIWCRLQSPPINASSICGGLCTTTSCNPSRCAHSLVVFYRLYRCSDSLFVTDCIEESESLSLSAILMVRPVFG